MCQSGCTATNIYLFITLRGCKLAVNLRQSGEVSRSLFSAYACFKQLLGAARGYETELIHDRGSVLEYCEVERSY